MAERTTVLPRVDGNGGAPRVVSTERTRYERARLLGAGGMGEVSLVRDHDIDRLVAVKHLAANEAGSLVHRFADEVRTIGRLEHPNIVPIHDVGLDADGRYFFVMKYVDGETLEKVIEKLRAGDPDATRRYPFERRVEIFIGLLRALDFAHAQGIVHRDVKPANLMVGKYGEVVLMDWGIAKVVGRAGADLAAARPASDGKSGAGDERERLFTTQHGELVGTVAYMSPEQARGENDAIDARSDLYSACVLFHEFVTLRHYLADKANRLGMIVAIESEEQTFGKLTARAAGQPPPPAELVHFLRQGLQKDRAKRFQSAGEMIERLQGAVRVQCPGTFAKRFGHEFGRFVDRHPQLGFTVLVTTLGLVGFALVELVRAAL